MGSIFKHVLFVGGILFQIPFSQVASSLWGKEGEGWNKNRLQDFTHAGYKQGLESLPRFDVKINVRALGAKGDGITDDTKAFREAIRQCPPHSALLIPAGTYILSDTLIIGKGGITLRGEGRGKTVLSFQKGLQELYYGGVKTHWSWEGAMILFKGKITDVGIEQMTIRFPDSAYAGHHFNERGYNGIGFSNGVMDGWIQGVALINCDLGIYLRDVTQITATDWSLEFQGVRETQALSGHHGVNCYAQYNLFHNFEIKGRYVHALSVESGSKAASYNVFSHGKGKDINFDHHGSGTGMINTNLWTDIDAGIGTDIYSSGGDSGGYWWQNETFWNIYGNLPARAPNDLGIKSHDCNFVANAFENARPAALTGTNHFVERIDPARIYPKNMYWAQMKLLHNVMPSILDSMYGSYSGLGRRQAAVAAEYTNDVSLTRNSGATVMEARVGAPISGNSPVSGNRHAFDFSGRRLPNDK